MHEHMQERSVWIHVLDDILGVIPSPILRHAMPGMSSQELTRRSKSIVRHTDLFKQERIDIRPSNCRSGTLPGAAQVLRAQLVPGGNHIIAMLEDATLRLLSANDFEVLARSESSESETKSLQRTLGWKDTVLCIGSDRNGKCIAVAAHK